MENEFQGRGRTHAAENQGLYESALIMKVQGGYTERTKKNALERSGVEFTPMEYQPTILYMRTDRMINGVTGVNSSLYFTAYFKLNS